MDRHHQRQSLYGIPILSILLTLPAFLYILTAIISYKFFNASTGFTGLIGIPYLLLDFRYHTQFQTTLFSMYEVCGPLFGLLLSIAFRSDLRRTSTMEPVQSGQVYRLNTAAVLLCALTIGLLLLAFFAHAVAGT